MKKVLNREDCFLFGHIRKSQGIHGAVKIVRENDLEIPVEEIKFLFLDLSDGLIPFMVESLDELSGISLSVKFVDIPNVEETKDFQNIPVYLPLEMLPADAAPEAEEAWIGFEVSDKVHGVIGKVSGFIHFNEQSLMQVSGVSIVSEVSSVSDVSKESGVGEKGREILIPMVPEIILSVDMKKKLITVELPEGLVDLND